MDSFDIYVLDIPVLLFKWEDRNYKQDKWFENSSNSCIGSRNVVCVREQGAAGERHNGTVACIRTGCRD
jgi:hypothetical protein